MLVPVAGRGEVLLGTSKRLQCDCRWRADLAGDLRFLLATFDVGLRLESKSGPTGLTTLSAAISLLEHLAHGGL